MMSRWSLKYIGGGGATEIRKKGEEKNFGFPSVKHGWLSLSGLYRGNKLSGYCS